MMELEELLQIESIYKNRYKQRHSDKLNEYFKISPIGIDYYNPFNIAIEFKESFSKKDDKMFFKIPEKQLSKTHLIVCCKRDEEFYIKESIKILNNEKYKFNTIYKRCCLRLTTIEREHLFKCVDYKELQIVLNTLKEMKEFSKCNGRCPYLETIIDGDSKKIYWCRLFPTKTKECIVEGFRYNYKECSYFLFPEINKNNEVKKNGKLDNN